MPRMWHIVCVSKDTAQGPLEDKEQEVELSQEAREILAAAELSTLLPRQRLSMKDNLQGELKDE